MKEVTVRRALTTEHQARALGVFVKQMLERRAS